jgi:hypothetical protein
MMAGARRLLAKWPGGRLPLWLLALICSPPLLVTLVWRQFDGSWWWRDFDAVLCAGVRHAQGLPIYAAHPACAGLGPADFVYPPQIAWLAAGIERFVGLADLRVGFAVVQIGVCLWLGWLMFLRPLEHLSLRARIPALALIDGGIIVCGNLAIACHALVAASLLGFRRTRLPFIAAVAAVSVLKPIYAIYLVVLLLDKAPWRVRLVRGGIGALALAAVGAAIWRTGGPEFGAWQEALHRVVVHGKPGGGLLGLFGLLGLPTTGVAPLAAFLLCAALLTICGLAIAEARGGSFSADERWLFGLGLAQLINPRPLGYDFVMLAPAIAMAAIAARDISPAVGRAARAWLTAACFAFWTLVNVGMGGQAALAATPMLSLGFLAVGLALVWRRLAPQPIAGRVQRPQEEPAL